MSREFQPNPVTHKSYLVLSCEYEELYTNLY